MAPTKKRKVSGHTDLAPAVDTFSPDFCSNEAKSSFRILINRKVIQERGICNKPPFDAYIRKHNWETFCQTPVGANITMSTEFYANMRCIDKAGLVLCRGKKIKISPGIINEYYRLESQPEGYSEYDKLMEEATVDKHGNLVGIWHQMVREITQHKYSMEEILPHRQWGHIDKKYLTMEMNIWYSFVASRLFPVTINSEVQWERIRLLYALKKNIRINVGSVIFCSMTGMVNSTSGWGFHSLVTGLCHRAGCEDRLDDIRRAPMAMLTYEAFQRRGKKETVIAKGTDEGSSSAGSIDILARVDKIEHDINYVRQIAEHSAKILALQFPEAARAAGPFPKPPADTTDTGSTMPSPLINATHPPSDVTGARVDGSDEKGSKV